MQLQHVDNYTPFEWLAFEKMGPGKRIHDVLIVKAACQFAMHGGAWRITPADAGDTAPIHMADEPHDHGAGAYASLRVAGDTLLYKPATDLLISGHATPAKDRNRTWAAEISIRSHGKERKQTLVLHGERHWQWGLTKGWHLSEPQPCEQLALRYELAYGGSYQQADQWMRYDPNPVGRGFFPVHRMDREVYYPAARIELLDNRLTAADKPIAVPGLGPLPRTWASRKRLAGTYDQRWQDDLRRTHSADYPADFDPRFFQAAHPHWIFDPHWRGDEAISLAGFSADQPITGQLPHWQPVFEGSGAMGTIAAQPMKLDTVEICLDLRRVYLTWRLVIDQQMQVERARVRLESLA